MAHLIQKWRHFLICLLVLVTCAGAIPTLASPSNSIFATFLAGETSAPDVTFSLYKVAAPDKQWESEYAEYRLSIDWESEASISFAAGKLADYIGRDNKQPVAEAVTDRNGKVRFINLSDGIYLLMGESYTSNGSVFSPAPVLLSVPLADPNIQIKYEWDKIQNPNPEYISHHVLKTWHGVAKDERPEEIEVQLFRNGKLYDTKKLSAANSWRHTWTRLEKGPYWDIVEAYVPAGYSVSYKTEGYTTVITNTKEDIPDKPERPTDPVDPTDEEDKLPQTGLLWWPVPVMLGLALLLFAIWIGGKKSSGALIFMATVLVIASICLTVSNLREDQDGGHAAAAVLETLSPIQNEVDVEQDKEQVKDYQLAPEADMPAVEVDGRRYIGTLSIPSRGIDLPVLETYTEAGLKTAPCLYQGSIYTKDAVIAGHSYRTHLQPLRNMEPGEAVIFTDMDGNQFNYQVDAIDTIAGTDKPALAEGNWDLSVFTCAANRTNRVVLRCVET